MKTQLISKPGRVALFEYSNPLNVFRSKFHMNLLIIMILCGLYLKSKKIINKICRVKMCIFSNTLKYIWFLMNILQDI